jgi:hypothetical protein
MGVLAKWAILSLIGAFVLAAQFGDSVAKLWRWALGK